MAKLPIEIVIPPSLARLIAASVEEANRGLTATIFQYRWTEGKNWEEEDDPSMRKWISYEIRGQFQTWTLRVSEHEFETENDKLKVKLHLVEMRELLGQFKEKYIPKIRNLELEDGSKLRLQEYISPKGEVEYQVLLDMNSPAKHLTGLKDGLWVYGEENISERKYRLQWFLTKEEANNACNNSNAPPDHIVIPGRAFFGKL